jgi:hypothetical protein
MPARRFAPPWSERRARGGGGLGALKQKGRAWAAFEFRKTGYSIARADLLVPPNASACAPNCTAAVGVNTRTDRTRRHCTTSSYPTIDASDAHRCQWPPNSGVRSINR